MSQCFCAHCVLARALYLRLQHAGSCVLPAEAHADIILYVRTRGFAAEEVRSCSEALSTLLQRWQAMLSNRAVSARFATQIMPTSRQLIKQIYMLNHCTAEDDMAVKYTTHPVKLMYGFISKRLRASLSSDSVELVLFDDLEHQTLGLAAAAFEMVRFRIATRAHDAHAK